MIVAGGVYRHHHIAQIQLLASLDFIAHGVHPLGIVDDLFRENQGFAQLVQDASHLIAQSLMMQDFVAGFLIVAVAGTAVN